VKEAEEAVGAPTADRVTSPDQLDAVVQAAKHGNLAAFSRLYELFGKKILNYIFRLTGSRNDAEDLMQDTFVLAFSKLQSLKENAKFQSWLFRIAQNNVFQKYRGKPVHMQSLDEPSAEGAALAADLPAGSKGPEQAALSVELERVVQQAIRELPERYRHVFVLSAVHKLSYLEIAEIVGRSLAAVKSDIHRARVEVRDKIKAYLGDNYGMSNLF
jgi:RNA polymerase sigma-70 factor (ECF subfamily)